MVTSPRTSVTSGRMVSECYAVTQIGDSRVYHRATRHKIGHSRYPISIEVVKEYDFPALETHSS